MICPIPSDQTPASISDNIKLALKNNGYTGNVSMVAYSSSSSVEQINEEEEFESAGIKLIQPDSRSKLISMFKDIYIWGITHMNDPTNLLIISDDDISQDEGIVEALVLLRKRDNNILLSHPRNASAYQLEGILSTKPEATFVRDVPNGIS
ncbi:PREDICTED: uncharacterized protein LOC104781512 isoform X2 [Camelina sativa]|uniref:Uncharacterized protein LOC104781512 isoform X2 n=1 Tax=Camelina sativa TaxID=90675 RepID=A0ABM1RMX1_CAMSA|nr:PREDICTED: uncharacterized protein LOC104781512 isoform X2 [Camelina sativa]